MKYEKVVYISHPYSGKKENEIKVAEIIAKLIKECPTYLFLSPIHAFSFAYETVDYETGIEYCLWLLEKSNEMWVYGKYEDSKGCLIEIEHCEEDKIPYHIKKG